MKRSYTIIGLLLNFAVALQAWAAISANTVFELRTTGNDNNGGGFVAGASGTDRSQSDAAFVSGTNLTVDATTNTDVDADGHTEAAADVGNIIQITAGAGFTTGFYQIASIQSGKWRLDRSPAATGTSGSTWALGGALASPGKVGSAVVAGNGIWIKAGTYACTNSTNVSGGRYAGSGAVFIQGYNTTRGDLTPTSSGRPLLQGSGAGTNAIINASNGSFMRYVNVDCNSVASCNGINGFGNGGGVYFCTVINVGASARALSGSTVFGCKAVAAAAGSGEGGFLNGSVIAQCEFINLSVGMGSNGHLYLVDCVFDTCTTGISITAGLVMGCDFRNGTTALSTGILGATAPLIINCITDGQTTAITCPAGLSGAATPLMLNSANRSGTIDSDIPSANKLSPVTLSATPFVDGANRNYALNATGLAALKNLGFGTFPGGATISYPDIGAAQHQAGVSGRVNPIGGGPVSP